VSVPTHILTGQRPTKEKVYAVWIYYAIWDVKNEKENIIVLDGDITSNLQNSLTANFI